MRSLKARLQNPDYINWVKAGLCSIHTKSGLDDFADTASQSLHQNILTNIIPAFVSAAQPVCGIVIKKQKLVTKCTHLYCQSFLAAVIYNGIDPTHTFTVKPGNLANCDVGQWHKHHWQVSKLFMNPGQLPTQVNSCQTDMSGIINYISHCRVPRRKLTNNLLLHEVRKARNGIMHTADMALSDADLKTYSQAMIDLLKDPGISCFPTAQLAVTEIQTIINAVKFQITLEDEGKVIDELAAAMRAMAEEIKYEVKAAAECGEVARKAIKEQLHEEIHKVSDCYEVLKGLVEESSGTQNQMEDKVKSLKDLLGKVTEDLRTFENKIEDFEEQQLELAKQQETCQQTVDDLTTKQYATDQALGNLIANQETTDIKTKQAIDEVRVKQDLYQKQTQQSLDEITATNAHTSSIPLDKDAKQRLRQYMQITYKDHLQVTPLSNWASIHVQEIFTPVVFVGNNKEMLVSYNDLFYKKGVLQNKIMLLGKAGAGKTTICKHLADVWCNPTARQQFDDVEVLRQYKFLFYVSFRFAEKNETVLEMIENQLFDNEEMKDIAFQVLKHNSDSCLILMDGFDELQRSALAKTGKRVDITGFPSLKGVQNCVFIITSRPWKFFSIPKDEQVKFSQMELDGIKDEKEMVKLILQKLEEPDPVKSCSDLQGQIRKNSLSEIMKSPMMLIFAIDVWESEKTLPKSICINFIKIIESFIRRYQTKCDEVIIENANSDVKKLLDKYSESAKLLPNVFSHYECIQTYAGLFLSLGHLASAFLLGLERQSLVFQIDDCKKYNINEGDGSLKLCLDLGFLIKLESTMRGIKRTENFQFCHKTIQEFFAALWLSRKYNEDDCQEDLDLHSCIETEAALLDNGVLIQFLCGLNPESGSDLWTCIVQKDIILPGYRMLAIQNLILKTVKEARDCYVHQKEQVYYCIPRVCIVETTSDEDVALLCKMIIQNNSTYLKSLRVDKANCLSSSQYHSLLSSISYATNLTSLTLHSISNQTNDSNDRLPVLDLHKLNLLQRLVLSKIYISRLLLPSQEELQICELCLYHLVLPHDNLVQLCTSLSSLSDLKELELTNLSCIDHSSNCCSAVLDLHKHHRLEWLALDTIYVSGLLLPSQVAFQLCDLCLDNLVLVHENLVQLCTSLSLLSGLRQLRLKNLSCSDHSGSCRIPVLDLSKHQRLIWLEIDNILISDLLFPSQVELQLRELILSNLLLSDDNLVELCTTLSSLSSLDGLKLTNLSCIDHSDSCRFPMLDLHKLHRLKILRLDTIPISRLLMPSQEESDLTRLYLCNLVLSHDNLVQLCTALSYLSGFAWLRQPNLSCSDHIDRFCPAVQDIYKHAKSKG